MFRKSLIITAAVSFTAGGCAVHKTADFSPRPEQTVRSEVDFSVKKPSEFELPNGMKVMFIHDDELPFVKGKLFFRGGSLFESEKETGISAAVGEELRDGGVRGILPDELDRRLDSRAATIEANIGEEFGTVSFSSLSEDFEEIFSLFRRVVREPAFDESRLELWKTQALDSIRRRKEDPESMASAVFHQALFGVHSPYSAMARSRDVAALTRGDLERFYQRFSRPDGSLLVVVGAVDPVVLRRAIEREFGNWERGRIPAPQLETPKVASRGGIYVVEGPFNQASIVIGHQGPVRLTPDTPSIGVFNRYFGYDAFGSLLFSEIRSKLGLAYAVNGAILPGSKIGTLTVMMGTRSTEALRSISETLRVMRDVQNVLPPADELSRIKTSLTRTFVFNFSTPDAIATRAATLALLSYPPGYDEGYIERVSKVTPESVLDVAKKRLFPDQSIIVVVGNVKVDAVRREFGDRFPVHQVRFDEVPIFE